MEKSKPTNHLPFMGVGPLYVSGIIALTTAAIILSESEFFAFGKIGFLKIPFSVIAGALIVLGLLLYGSALFSSKIDKHIKSNTLAQTGAYAYVRNPIYSAFMMFCTAALLFENNLCLLVLPPIFWAFMTVLMKYTEEKWLLDLYGEEYRDYCSRVNRCIPWLKKK